MWIAPAGHAQIAITMVNNPGGGTLSGTTQVQVAGGAAPRVAVFSDVHIDKVGAGYTLQADATQGPLNPDTSAAFTITAGVPASIVVNGGNNQSAPAGTAVAAAPSVLLRDAFANIVPNASVTFAVTAGGGSVTGASQTTNAAGVATVDSWTLGAIAGTNTLSATAAESGITGNPVTFTATGTAGTVDAAQSTVVAAPTSITAGTETSTITVTAKDALGNPIQGATVVLATTGSGNTLTQPVGTTNASGVASGTLSSTIAESKSVAATINGVAVTQTAAVAVTAGAVSADQSTVVAAPTSITAGTETSTITVTAKDEFGNLIAGATVLLAATGTGNFLTQPQNPTDASGVATGSLSSTIPETKTVSATINAISITQTATVIVELLP
jgi:adhesin/invasin